MRKSIRLLWVALAGAVLVSGCMEGTFPRHGMNPGGNVAAYRRALEQRLLAKYNALPDWHDKVSHVELVLPRPPERSVDGELTRVEFTQIVYDRWGERIPALEDEYYIVTFGKADTWSVQAEPTVSVGLDAESDFGAREPIPVVSPRNDTPAPDGAYAPVRSEPVVGASAPAFHSTPPPAVPSRYTHAARPSMRTGPSGGRSLMVGPGGRGGDPAARQAGPAPQSAVRSPEGSVAGTAPRGGQESFFRDSEARTRAESVVPETRHPDETPSGLPPPVSPDEFSRLLRGEDTRGGQEPYQAMQPPAGSGQNLPRGELRGLESWRGGPELE